MNKFFIFASMCLMVVSCKQNTVSEEVTDIQHQEDMIIVPDKSDVNSKIKLYTVAEQDYSTEFNTIGVVKVVSGKMAEIAPPFDGRISQSFIALGQKVSKGTPLFEISSSEFFEAVKNYYQTLQTQTMQEKNLQRQQDLFKNGVGVAKELEEAETEYDVALKDYENATATLKMFDVSPEEVAMGQALKVVSPIAGEVVQTNMVIGQYIKSDASPLAIVADLDKVWVVAQVKEKYISHIQKDDKVEITSESNPGQVIHGYVSYISELLDEDTRSIQVFITCDNSDRRLKPGMFTDVHFISLPKPSIVIPSTALLQEEDDSYVFLEVEKGKYRKQKVSSTTANLQQSLITDGLVDGNVIIAEGGIYLMGN